MIPQGAYNQVRWVIDIVGDVIVSVGLIITNVYPTS